MKRLISLLSLVVILTNMAPLPVLAMTTPLLIMNSATNPTSATVDRFTPLAGSGAGVVTGTSVSSSTMPIGGTFSKLYVRMPTALSAGTSYAVTLQKNHISTAVACTVTDASITCSNTSDTITVAAGDTVTIKISPSGTPAVQTIMQIGLAFDGSTEGESPLFSTDQGTVVGSVAYASAGRAGSWNTTENVKQDVFPTNGVLDKFYVNVFPAPGAGKSYAFMLRKNGADTGVTCTIADTAKSCSDLTHSVSVAAGDLLSLSETPTGTPTQTNTFQSLRFVPTINGESVMMSANASPNATLNRYMFTGGATANDGVETNSYSIAPVAFTWKNTYTSFNTAPGTTRSRTIVSRINSATSTISVNVADTNTTGNDTTHSDSVVAGDIIDWGTFGTNSPTGPSSLRLGAVMYVAPAAATAIHGFASSFGLLYLNGFASLL